MASNRYTPGSIDDPHASVDYSIPQAERQGLISRPRMAPTPEAPRAAIDRQATMRNIAQDYSIPQEEKAAVGAQRVVAAPNATGAQERLFTAAQPLPASGVDTATKPEDKPAPSRPIGSEYPNPVSDQNRGVTRVGNSFSGKNLTEDMSKPLTSIDMNANNASMAKANAIRQSMLDDPNLGGGGPRGYTIPDAHAAETQQLFDKWANEALVKDMMNTKGGVAAAGNVYATQANNMNKLQGLDMQGRNQLAVTGAQGANQLAGIGMEGQNRLAVTEAQGANQLAGIGAQGANQIEAEGVRGKNSLATQELANKGALDTGRASAAGRVAAASMEMDAKHFDAIPKLLETMNPKDPNYTRLSSLYTDRLLNQHAPQQAQVPQSQEEAHAQAAAAYAQNPQALDTINARLEAAGFKRFK